ncbi:MAG: putative CoA-binding protein [Myxococcota bacterium]|jgi:predicted CoA-binding protein
MLRPMSTHPLQSVMRDAGTLVLIGDSSQDRFPAYSYHSYTQTGQPFVCLDLGGLTESRGSTAGGPVYPTVEALPEHGPLAIVWLKPRSATRGVEAAHAAGCTRIWFSFKTGHPDAVARAAELGMEVVEIGRCPVYYSANKAPACKAHTLLVKATGVWKRPPQLDPKADRRELY